MFENILKQLELEIKSKIDHLNVCGYATEQDLSEFYIKRIENLLKIYKLIKSLEE